MKIDIVLPDYVQKVARMLHKEGFGAYLVGGALRDIVLDTLPDDYDLATDAKPDQMLQIFPKSVSTGARFGMVSALVPDEKGEVHDVQVTTFRSEQQYIDGRWPSKVEFITDLDKDLGRRDFTFNAMAVDLSQVELDGSQEPKSFELYDPFDGMGDLKAKVVRAVGTPLERFKEDGLRAYKACRMASQLQFDIESATFEAIKQALPVAAMVSKERIRDEFMKILMQSPKPSRGIELLRQTGLLELFLPELLEGYGVVQRKFHADDVYWHSLKTLDAAPDRIKLAALFHDIGKPRKDMGDGHFYGHDIEGARMSEEVMKRLKFSSAETKRVSNLVRHHMFYYPYVQQDMDEEKAENVRLHMWSDSAVRRFVARVGEENIEDLFALRIADAVSNPKSAFEPEEIELIQERISRLREEEMALKITDLQIRGNDLIEAGIPAGPVLGEIMEYLLDQVLEDPLNNTKEKLLELALEKYRTYSPK